MKKKVLFISSRPIYPIIGGDQIRTAQQLEFLLQKYDVDVIYQSDKNNDESLRMNLPKVHKITCFEIQKSQYYRQALRFLFNKLPLQVNYYYNKPVQQYIDSCIDNYDMVFCNNIRTAEYVRCKRKPVKIIDFVDAISMNYEKAKNTAKGLMKLIYTIDHIRCKRYEQKVLADFDRCAIISNIDKQYILTNRVSSMNSSISVVGNKVDIPDKENISRHENDNKLLFVGKMDYEPNVVAVKSFVERIFPVLLEKYKNLKFYIVGSRPDIRVQKLHNNSNIIVTGFVDSLEPYFKEATIVVAPMLTGAGIQNKIIQAMSYGCCVVTTPIGAEGLNILNYEIAICDNENNMIESISSLLEDRDRRKDMGFKSRKYVENNLSPEFVGKEFWEFLKGI